MSTEIAVSEKSKTEVILDSVSESIKNKIAGGLVLPQHYSYMNAVQASLLKLTEVQTRDKRPVLEACTAESIQSALIDMVQQGLDVSKSQGYFVAYGNKLKFMKQYQGVVAKLSQFFPDYTPCPQVVHEGDVFEYAFDGATGRRYLTKHEQSFLNLDNPFVAAYLYIPTKDGGQELYVMTRKMIGEAWKKSNNKSYDVHKAFPIKMAQKTIINSALTPLLQSMMETKGETNIYEGSEYDDEPSDAEEVEEVEVIDETQIEDGQA
jgi:recombination protein RecT